MIHPEFSKPTNSLIENGIIQIPVLSGITIASKELMDTWKLFCAQPLEHKLKYEFGSAGGYEYKNKSKDLSDEKENFHFSLMYLPENLLTDGTDIDKKLFSQARRLITLSFLPVMECASFYKEILGDSIEMIIAQSMENWIVRLLHYPAQEEQTDLDSIIAASHVDKGFTLHFIEDAPGFEYLWNGGWHSAKPEDGNVLAYAGMNGQYYSQCKFSALCHRVKTSRQTIAYGRNSIVLFADFGDVAYDKAQFGRLQKCFPAGENYGMSFNEFKKFFTSIENKIL